MVSLAAPERLLYVTLPGRHPGAGARNYFTGAASGLAWVIPHGPAWAAARLRAGAGGTRQYRADREARRKPRPSGLRWEIHVPDRSLFLVLLSGVIADGRMGRGVAGTTIG